MPLNATVAFTCSVENFYPSEATLIWLENNTRSETAKVEPVTQNWDGTSSLKGTLELLATEERNLSVFSCLVTHDSQPPVNETVTLTIRPQAEGGESASDTGAGECGFPLPLFGALSPLLPPPHAGSLCPSLSVNLHWRCVGEVGLVSRSEVGVWGWRATFAFLHLP